MDLVPPNPGPVHLTATSVHLTVEIVCSGSEFCSLKGCNQCLSLQVHPCWKNPSFYGGFLSGGSLSPWLLQAGQVERCMEIYQDTLHDTLHGGFLSHKVPQNHQSYGLLSMGKPVGKSMVWGTPFFRRPLNGYWVGSVSICLVRFWSCLMH